MFDNYLDKTIIKDIAIIWKSYLNIIILIHNYNNQFENKLKVIKNIIDFDLFIWS